MEMFIYQCEGDDQLRFSLAFEVDEYAWRNRGRLVKPIFQTRSIAKAFWYVKRNQPDTYTSLTYSRPIWKCGQQIGQVEQIYHLCEGRALLLSEIKQCLRQNKIGISDTRLLQILQILYLEGRLFIQPSVEWDDAVTDWCCNRCNAGIQHLQQVTCLRCDEHCVMCQHCHLLGKSCSCEPLLLFRSSVVPMVRRRRKVMLASIFYTPWQQRAIEKLEYFMQSVYQRLLLWAVTGAGKTEVVVPIIQKVLQQGKRVLWVTPRKDVVLELIPRLRQIFYQERLIGMYGGSRENWIKADFVVATVHQAMRFHQFFDLVIVDEVDAFPLYRNRMLDSGLRRSLHPRAKEIYLTATPPAEWKSLLKQRLLQVVMLPVRYHGKPLPVPRIIYEWSLSRKLVKQKDIPAITSFVRQVQRTYGQAFIFVPRIRDVELVCRWLRIQHPELKNRIAGVHARCAERSRMVELFRQQKLDFLVTTTILERGVTVPTAHVLVLFAEHSVFERATLVQIAGRVGRAAHYQQGQVIFLTSQRTEAQVQAIQECKRLNIFGKKEGFSEREAYCQ
ncbi:competence protein ComFA [Seinonella peptonophila]|uniref:Competence protein ComFA n=1 Tax=Seinonella peptonophila TaxID=112248 RepID=A0A1M4XRU1_9BACL|nr:helicase-related protein [Seinonella peptonophila]SHE96086.1 competence protein ComFA [Seinonella peptonophila]